MTLFWIICAVLLIVALLFVVLPLWRKTGGDNDVLRDAANLEILRDQAAELDADFQNGMLTQEAYEQGQRELQARLLEEVDIAGQPAKSPHHPARVLAIVLAVLLPLFSVLLYGYLGNIDALSPQQQETADDSGILRSAAALKKLEKELQKRPENPDGWWTLARSYSELGRYQEALEAYRKLVELVPDEAQLWANYADTYAMAHNRNTQGEVINLLNKALALDANNPTALALSGTSAMDRGDYAAAIAYWQKLVNVLPPNSQDARMFAGGIQQAQELLAAQKGGKVQPATVAKPAQTAQQQPGAAAGQLSGKVSLGAALASKAAPTDTVYIMARAGGEANMPPLAVLRKQVKDLPLQFAFDDSMAMQPQLKLSGFDQVVVVARVSKSGTPKAQPGDLQGMTGTIKPNTKGLNIVIDSVVK